MDFVQGLENRPFLKERQGDLRFAGTVLVVEAPCVGIELGQRKEEPMGTVVPSPEGHVFSEERLKFRRINIRGVALALCVERDLSLIHI